MSLGFWEEISWLCEDTWDWFCGMNVMRSTNIFCSSTYSLVVVFYSSSVFRIRGQVKLLIGRLNKHTATLVRKLSWTVIVGSVQVQRWRFRLRLRILRRIKISLCGINIRKGLTAGLPSDVESYWDRQLDSECRKNRCSRLTCTAKLMWGPRVLWNCPPVICTLREAKRALRETQ